jgi:PTS system cellobiose-specific IIA component
VAFSVRERHTGKKMKDINSIAIEVVMKSGDGRVKIDEALDALALGDLAKAETLLKEASDLVVQAHNAQTEVIQSQVGGENMEYSLLFIHAQDTLMTINTELRMAKKLLPIVKMLLAKKEAE